MKELDDIYAVAGSVRHVGYRRLKAYPEQWRSLANVVYHQNYKLPVNDICIVVRKHHFCNRVQIYQHQISSVREFLIPVTCRNKLFA